MHTPSLPLAALSLLASNALAAPASVPELYANGVQKLGKRQTISGYQPVSAACPDTPLVRDATELGPEESAYISSRKEKADAALADWLQKQGEFSTDSQPTVALASSGGGYRAQLAGAGVVKAFDARDSNASVSGLFQALTYHSGLSGELASRVFQPLTTMLTLIRRLLAFVFDSRQRLAHDQLLARGTLGRLSRQISSASCKLAVFLWAHSVWRNCH